MISHPAGRTGDRWKTGVYQFWQQNFAVAAQRRTLKE
jgi:hypothetical protein